MNGKKEKYPNLEKLLNLRLPVRVILAEKDTTLEEILNFAVGSIIMFKKHNSKPLNLLVNDQAIGSGKTIKVNEHFALHVREIGTPQENLKKIAATN